VYFNNIKKYFVNRSFDLDYLGISEKAALEYILKYDKRSNIKVYSYGYSWLKGSVTILGDIESKRVTVTSINDSDYVIDRNVPFHENKLIDENIFIKYYEIKVDDNIINIIYKKKQ